MLTKIIKNFLSNKSLFLGDKDIILDNKSANLIIQNILNKISCVDDGIIGIMLPRSINYILAILAIWQSGRSFVPLNYDWPKNYLNFIIKRSNIKSIITDKKNKKLKNINKIFYEKKKVGNTKKKVNGNVAYIIFTSGSTGEPKGVQISKNAFLNYFNWVKKNQKSKKKLNHLITGEITFDIIIADLVFAIANNASIFISDDAKNVFSVLDLIKKNKINSIYCVPSLMNQIIDAAKALSIKFFKFEFVFCGGDIFKFKLYKKIKKKFKKARIFNMYGPTECTINSLGVELSKIKKISKLKSIPTGYRFKHLNYLILNEKNEKKTQGELLISGNQLMDGYLSDKKNDLVKPFIKIKRKWFYKTGDIFRKEKKLFYFVGRKNKINKVSGYRLNFSFIEDVIEKLSFIKEFKLYSEGENLYGFYTSKKKVNSIVIKKYFKKKFPSYMIPKKIINLKDFPYNNRGKVNFKLLQNKI